ncbi:TspO/MBR family protein [Ancylobacter terrae]|uniref:TspO/MBR family protein n=1 Tax=Ancylobacter sp. sgz301288 TaxID=3342077 RepID=UPI003858FDB9
MKTLSLFRLVLALGLCLAVGAIGSLATAPQIPTWYAGLAKPGWTPPDFVFPVVWTLLYVMMAVALWRLWDRHPPGPARATAIRLFALQLALNFIWTPVFFGLEAIGWGVAIILALWLAIAAAIWAAARVDRPAAWLLVPYLGWVSYASALNIAIFMMNS